jgi:hypothetical protein
MEGDDPWYLSCGVTAAFPPRAARSLLEKWRIGDDLICHLSPRLAP